LPSKKRQIKGKAFISDRFENFELPTGLANNIKGTVAELIGQNYLWNKLIPELRKQYDIVHYLSPQVPYTNFERDFYSFQRSNFLKRLKIARKMLVSTLSEWILPPTVKGGYLVVSDGYYHKEDDVFEVEIFLDLDPNEPIIRRPVWVNRKDRQGFRDIDALISSGYFISWENINKTLTLKKALGELLEGSQYIPDCMLLLGKIEGTKDFHLIPIFKTKRIHKFNIKRSDLEKHYELPILKIEKVLIIEVKGGSRRFTFTNNQIKLIKNIPTNVPIEFLIIHVPIGDIISLKEAQIHIYKMIK